MARTIAAGMSYPRTVVAPRVPGTPHLAQRQQADSYIPSARPVSVGKSHLRSLGSEAWPTLKGIGECALAGGAIVGVGALVLTGGAIPIAISAALFGTALGAASGTLNWALDKIL